MWNFIKELLKFTGVEEVTVWQDVFLGALIIPFSIYIARNLSIWWNSVRPSRLIFRKCRKKDLPLYIFPCQMSGADINFNFVPNQNYVVRYPFPTPGNHANLQSSGRQNIDPVYSKADTECLADVYNILGSVGKVKNIKIGDLISDWNVWNNPIFTIGFNPKTTMLIGKCSPIHFILNPTDLEIVGSSIRYNSNLANDAGIIQKTFLKDKETPVFILAGHGTTGTSAAGYIFNENFVKMGKLYGSDSFCIFLKANVNDGKSSAEIDKICPTPKWYRIALYPLTYYNFYTKSYFNI